MKGQGSDFTLLDARALFLKAELDFEGTNYERLREQLRHAPRGSAARRDILNQHFAAAREYAEREVANRTGRTKVYGKRQLKLVLIAQRIQGAMAVRPPLQMKDVARYAGISRAALYRHLKRPAAPG